MSETIPAVDAAEVAKLANAAEAEPVDTRRYTERDVPERKLNPTLDAGGEFHFTPTTEGRIEPAPRPDRGVAAQLALAAEIAAMAERMERLEAQSRHTMLLVMVLAERAHVDAGEYDKAVQQMRKAEAAAKGQS